MRLQIVLLILVVSSTTAKDLCCFPKQYGIQVETSIVLKERRGNDVGSDVTNFLASIAVDYSKRNMISFNIRRLQPTMSNFRIIQDLGKNVSYFVDLDKRKCERNKSVVTPLNCLPAGPKLRESYLGHPSNPFKLTTYKVTILGGSFNLAMHTPLLRNECSLVSAIAVNEGGVSMYTNEFFNYTLGTQDPSMFDIPAYCNHGNEPTLKFFVEDVMKMMNVL